MGYRNAHFAFVTAASPVCGVLIFDAARPTLEAYPLHLISQVSLAADLAGTKTQATSVCDDGALAALAEKRKTRK